MTVGLATVAGVVAFLAWRLHVRNRRLRATHARMAVVYGRRQERAARTATRPYAGHVAAAPIHPPTNGRP